ncbi:MAG: alpha/beta fold hydrolase [Halobacteriota archaeon]
MEQVTHHGRDIAYRTFDRGGSGPTVLCIHGGGGTHRIWKSQARLADRVPIVALDLSGHGDSDDVDSEPGFETLSAYVDDTAAVANAVGADVLVGNSLGGAVALQTAVDREIELDKLVLAGTGAKLAVLDDLLAWLEDDFERALEFLHAPDRFFHDPDPQLVELSIAAMRETGQTVTLRDFLTSHTFDVRDELDGIDVSALAIVGEYDKLTPVSYHEYLVDRIPDGRLETIDDAAHLSMLERPDAFNEALEAFLLDE